MGFELGGGEEAYGGEAVAEPGGGVGAAEAEAETSRPSSKNFLKKDMIKKQSVSDNLRVY